MNEPISHKIISSEQMQKYLKGGLDDIFKAMYENFEMTKIEAEAIISTLSEKQIIEFMEESGRDSGDVVSLSIGLGRGMTVKYASERMYNRLKSFGGV